MVPSDGFIVTSTFPRTVVGQGLNRPQAGVGHQRLRRASRAARLRVEPAEHRGRAQGVPRGSTAGDFFTSLRSKCNIFHDFAVGIQKVQKIGSKSCDSGY